MPIAGEFYSIKRARKWRGCIGKRQFEAEDKAFKVARSMADSHPGERFEAYYCEFCAMWHVGHNKNGLGVNPDWKP